jgi:hypothetical protein
LAGDDCRSAAVAFFENLEEIVTSGGIEGLGGNSNWRGPIWFPTTFLIIESLRKLGTAFGSCYLVETPGSGGQPIALRAIARDIARRMIDIFLLDKNQRRPVYGGAPKSADDPNWRDHLLFLRVLPRR